MAVDANILVYTHRRRASLYHPKAKAVVNSFVVGRIAWAIPWPCVCEFFSLVTNPGIWKGSATSPQQAAARIDAWAGSPNLFLLAETDDFMQVLSQLIQQPGIRGGIVHDARIAALCLAYGVDELLTRDRDFQLFPQLQTRDPLQ